MLQLLLTAQSIYLAYIWCNTYMHMLWCGYIGTLASYRDIYEIVQVVLQKHGNLVHIDVMKLVKKVKIASRSFYLSQSIYILRGSHTVENSKHDIDDAGMRCSSGTYKVQVVRSSGTYSVSKGVLGRMGPMCIHNIVFNYLLFLFVCIYSFYIYIMLLLK